MTEDNQNKKKSELLNILQKADHDASDLTSKGREIVQQGQRISDLARYAGRFIQAIPDDSFFAPQKWDEYRLEWLNTVAQIDAANQAVGNPKSNSLIFVANSTTASSSTIISSAIIPTLPVSVQGQAWAAYNGFEQLLEQSNLVEEIAEEISRLGMTSPKEIESTLSLVRQAKAAFDTPSSKKVSPVAVLISIRGAINRVFADLLPKRPIQEKTSGDREKVRSICALCRRSDIKDEQIERFANEAYDLNDLLSDAKQATFNRDEVREYMNRALLFLRSFLQALDENKLRSIN
jgi:hypothetical protein